MRDHRTSSSRAVSPTDPNRVSVLLPLPLSEAYTYHVPEGVTAPLGSYVRVPLGSRTVTGVVWDQDIPDRLDAGRLKPVTEILDAPAMSAKLRQFVDWVAGYTLAPLGAVLRMAIGPDDAFAPAAAKTAYAAIETGDLARLTPQRSRVLAALESESPMSAGDLAAAAGCSPGVVRAMAAAGLLREVSVPARPPRLQPDPRTPFPPLSAAQESAARAITAEMQAGRYVPFLLDGVTGSGKTEVYFRAIAAALLAGSQVLVLLPEIALGAQWHDRFARQFGAPAVSWHSGISAPERRLVWRDVAEGTAQVVVGARSALFLPFRKLGLIVVDEEHDP